MKASHRAIARLLPLSGALLAVACVPAPEPTPAPTQTPVQTAPAPAPTPAPTPMLGPENWMDAPRTPGNWTYRDFGFGTLALYSNNGSDLFAVQCLVDDPASSTKRIALARPGLAEGQTTMRILTETTARTLTASSFSYGPTSGIGVFLPAQDRLLDAMALTKGRFAIETPGQPTLYLPSWAEVSRVIEDCR